MVMIRRHRGGCREFHHASAYFNYQRNTRFCSKWECDTDARRMYDRFWRDVDSPSMLRYISFSDDDKTEYIILGKYCDGPFEIDYRHIDMCTLELTVEIFHPPTSMLCHMRIPPSWRRNEGRAPENRDETGE